MFRALAVAVTAIVPMLSAPTQSWAAAPGPACRASTVVDVMTREIRAQNYYAGVDPDLITEQATPIANLVRCDVCVLQTPYEMTRFGTQPIRRCVAHKFEVRIVPNGFVIRDLH